jgi:MYXO-CTERM domain-containing protein
MLPYRLSRAFWSLPTLVCLALPLSAHAAHDAPSTRSEVSERPPTWDMSLDELRAIGLGQYRGDPVPVPQASKLRGRDAPAKAPKQGVIFVNFDGATLNSGFDDSRTNTTQIQQLAGPYAAYGTGPKREAVMQAVRENWAEYNFIVTDTRPASGDYTMNMTGPTNPFGSGVLGIAPLDCEDAQTHNNITFAFHSANDQFSATVQATTVSQEVAHSYGLEHVDEPGDIMNPYNAGGNASFIDACIQIVSNQGIACQAQHAAECGTGSSQNAHRELLTMFGPSTPDTQAPAVQIVSPSDGDIFDVGASFQINVVATDDTAVDYVELFNAGEAMGTDSAEPYGWSVSEAPKGVYELQVLAYDLAGNVGMSDVVTIIVGVEESPEENDDDEDGEDSSGSSPGGGTGTFPSGSDAEVKGCSCRETPAAPNLASLLVFGLLALRRRR